MPWVIIDFKDEDKDIINKIDGVIYLDYDTLPERPGIYMLKPRTSDIHGLFTDWLWMVLEHGNIGLYFDEVFPVGQRNEAFNTIMMQGRSKHIPVIACTQRPANVSTYCFSEATYVMVFDLTRVDDRKRVHSEFSFIPTNYSLPEYHSFYYNVPKKYDDKLGPAPNEREILRKIAAKMPPPARRTL